MNKKIIISLSVIAAVAAVVIGGTISYFSDTETSTGNTFTAGAIDLKVSNHSYYNGVEQTNRSWSSKDLAAGDLFFSFADLKPGDLGEDTIDLKVNSNDAYSCMNINVTGTPENGQSEPEAAVDLTTGTNQGELQNELHMTFWADDGDNVLETGEVGKVFVNNQTIQQISDSGNVILADSTKNVWTNPTAGGPMTGGQTYNIGKVFCFGSLVQVPVADGQGNPTEASGFTCNGADVTNASQTDGVTGDVSFTAVQSRNNAGFTCAASSISTVRVNNLDPSYTAQGGGGVWSAYYGPSISDPTAPYNPVSPGLTQVYDGREAGIIKAGLNTTPADDEGLFAVKPTVTVNALAAGVLTYDVETQFGVNPVWMTIEIDTGTVGDRSDNTTYQFVPTSNPSGWHTVNAAAGQWQKWNNGAGDTTGNPLISLSQVVTAHNGLNVVRTYLRLGMGESYYNGGTGTTAWVDKMTIGGVTYDFVL